MLLTEGLWIYGTDCIFLLSEIGCKCFRYRLALASKQFGSIIHWMQTGKCSFVFKVLLLMLFPKYWNPPFGFLCNTNFRVIKGFIFFYSLTVIGLWNQKELCYSFSGFIGQHVYCVGIKCSCTSLLKRLTFNQHFLVSNSWDIIKKCWLSDLQNVFELNI